MNIPGLAAVYALCAILFSAFFDYAYREAPLGIKISEERPPTFVVVVMSAIWPLPTAIVAAKKAVKN